MNVSLLKRTLKEPLLHFIAAGAAVFLLFQAVSPEGAGLGDKVIVVDRESLLTHIQYRTRTFEPRVAADRLAALSTEELDRMIREYVREEALHREAKAMGMDANDYIIKRRLIQKVEFLAQGFADASIDFNEEDLAQYLEVNRDDYFIEPQVTFTHVFFNADKRGREAARAAAEEVLVQLNAAGVPFAEAGRHGDRFIYHLNYVERPADLVASHFGPELAEAVFSAPAGDGAWRGPYASEYGAHLVLVSRSEPGRYPELAEVRARVLDDLRRTRARERLDAAIDEIIAGYEVRHSLDSEAAAPGRELAAGTVAQ